MLQAKGFVIALLTEDGLQWGYYSIDWKRMDWFVNRAGDPIWSHTRQNKKKKIKEIKEVKKLVPACGIGWVISNNHTDTVALKLYKYIRVKRKISFSRQDSGSQEN